MQEYRVNIWPLWYNWHMAAAERLVVVRVSPYPLEEHGGVAQNILESIPHLESQDIRVVPIGPSKNGMRENPSIIHYGKAIWSLSHDNTRTELLVARERTAQRILHELKPDVVHIDELIASLGFIFPQVGQLLPLLLKAPRRQDGKPIPAFGTTFHARHEEDRTGFRIVQSYLQRSLFTATKHHIPAELHVNYIKYMQEIFNNRLLAVSEATREFWQPYFSSNYEVLYNGIDTSKFSPEGPLLEQWINGKKTIFMAGRHDKRKGLDIGIEAYARLRQTRNDIQLKIAGVGEKTEELRHLIDILQIPDVEFVGQLSQEDLASAYRTADVFVSPATGGEGFGRVLAEAMASGTPVVASNIEGYREAMQAQPFTMAPEPGDIDGFAKAIANFLDLPDETRQTWKQIAPRYVKDNFSWSIIGPKQAEIYRRWVNEHGRTPRSEWPERKQRRKRGQKIPGEVRRIGGYLKKSGTIFRRRK